MTNYFELFGIPVAYAVDLADLRKRYFQLSRQVHPDYHTQANDADQQKLLELASQLNSAYTTLQDAELRLDYLLHLKQIVVNDEKYALPPAFLMEMMELNEALADAEAENNASAIQSCSTTIEMHEKQLSEDILALLQGINEAAVAPEVEKKLHLLYYQRKYLLRIKQKLNTFASR